jgi:small-conductance mechanosensitive channel
MWVRSRQYTGRIVNVSNAQIFSEPVDNSSREFAYIWEEMTLPISFRADRHRVEQIMLAATRHRTAEFLDDAAAIRELARQHAVQPQPVAPKVYYRLTDNWLELIVRFIASVRGVRELKDELSRDMLTELDKAGIGLASATFIVGLPPVRLVSNSPGNRTTHRE